MGQRDAEATRARILAAAVIEFAAHGHSGGRIDRIAKEAESNVRMIYAYFGNKSGLFDAALSDAIRRMAEEVPPRPTELPAWGPRSSLSRDEAGSRGRSGHAHPDLTTGPGRADATTTIPYSEPGGTPWLEIP